MADRKPIALIGAIIFLVLAGLNLYRLLVGFPITIGGYQVGGTASFLMMAAFGAISLILFRAAARGGSRDI